MVTWSIMRGERRLTAGLGGYFFLLVAALYLMKPARNALFIREIGTDYLPLVYIATAVLTWWVVVAYVRLTGIASMQTVVSATLAAAVVCLGGFWYWLGGRESGGAMAFYVWVKVYAVLLPSQFWLFAEEVLDPRQARRLFAPIGAGGILGGVMGSVAATAFGNVGLEARSLLIGAAVAVAAALVLFRTVLANAPARQVRVAASLPDTQTLAGYEAATDRRAGNDVEGAPHGRRLVFTITAILVVATMAHTIVDWQFNRAAEQQFLSEQRLMMFFGAFNTILNIMTLIVQMLATSFLLRHFGIGVALGLLPVAIASGAFGILLAPGIVSASLARGADDALRFSVDQSGRELLFLPFSSDDRRRLKPRIDLIANRAANGVAGLVILAAIWLFGEPLRYLSIVSLLLVAGWAVLVYDARRQYAHALQHLLRVRDPDISGLAQSRLDANARDAIREGLSSADRATVHTALSLAAHTEPAAFVEELRLVLRTSKDAVVKGQVLRLLTEAHDSSALSEALANVDQADHSLTAEALAYACATGRPEARARVRNYLSGKNAMRAVSAALCLLDQPDPDQQSKGIDVLREAATTRTPRAVELRVAIADVIRQRPAVGELRPILAILLDDEAPQVVRAALAACAHFPHPELVPPICEAGTRRALQGSALQALQFMGGEAIGALTGLIANPRNRRALRRFGARALGRIGGADAAAGLIAGLVAEDRTVRKATLKALNYMRRRGERLELGREREEAAISIEWRDYLSLQRLAGALGEPGTTSPTAFVATVVNERLSESEEQLFRALALHHPIQSLFFAYRGLITGDRVARAHAIELVDNIVETPQRRTLVRLLETNDRNARGRIAALELARRVPDAAEALHELLDPGDPWLAACAIRALQPGAANISRGLRQELHAHGYAPLAELLGPEV